MRWPCETKKWRKEGGGGGEVMIMLHQVKFKTIFQLHGSHEKYVVSSRMVTAIDDRGLEVHEHGCFGTRGTNRLFCPPSRTRRTHVQRICICMLQPGRRPGHTPVKQKTMPSSPSSSWSTLESSPPKQLVLFVRLVESRKHPSSEIQSVANSRPDNTSLSARPLRSTPICDIPPFLA